MNTKEAIEFLNVFKEYAKKNQDIPIYDRYIHSGTFLVNDEERLKRVISLLQQGEKYKEMWEELKFFRGTNKAIPQVSMYYAADEKYIGEIMKLLEQKYFPKEAK